MNKPFALLIEDDRDVAALFRHVLDMAGYHTESVFDGKVAMEKLSMMQPDVVLLDLQLPGISGVDILKQMRADERLKTIPVVVITAYAYFANSLPVEPDLFLLKPVDIHDLSNLIQRLRSTKEKIEEPPYDNVTHLYTKAFFSVRMVFAMERVKRMEVERFGVLFADLHPFKNLKNNLNSDVLNALLRKMADQFKSTLRPTDTMAWAHEGYFLTLFEEFHNEDIPLMIAKRVDKGLNDYLNNKVGEGVKAQVGIIMCDDGYDSVQDVLDDINFARLYIEKNPAPNQWIFTRKKLETLKVP